MATKNLRVAAYFPPELYKAFLAFKIQRGLATDDNPKQNDSQALIQLVSEFLEVSYLVNQEVAHSSKFVTAEEFEALVVHVMEISSKLDGFLAGSGVAESELPKELPSDSPVFKPPSQSIEARAVDSVVLVCGAVLAKRLGVGQSTISERKKSSPEDFAEWSREKDPDKIAWSFVADSNSFQPVNDVPHDLLSKLVGEPPEGFSVGELAKRLNIAPSTLSHWKGSDPRKKKSPDEIVRATRDKDPDGIGWILIPGTSRFRPEKSLPNESPAVQQGDLLSATLSDRVNPLPEGSERSGEG